MPLQMGDARNIHKDVLPSLVFVLAIVDLERTFNYVRAHHFCLGKATVPVGIHSH